MLEHAKDTALQRTRMRRQRISKANQWFVLSTPPQQEFKTRAKLERFDLATIVPAETKWKHRSGGRSPKETDYPLLPRYVFVGAEFQPPWRMIADETHARICFLGSRPMQLNSAEVEYLAALESGDIIPAGVSNPHKAVKVGELAKVSYGHALAGHTGSVHSIHGDTARISLVFLGSLREVDIRLAFLKAA